jgi:hypothetical protein
MVEVDEDALEADFDSGRARLRVRDLEVYDDHDIANSVTLGLGLPGGLGFPYSAIPPVAPIRATVSFDVEWKGIVDTAQIENTTQHFNGSFLSTGATIKWSAKEEGFELQSEAPDPTRNLISVLGREKNGVFFT